MDIKVLKEKYRDIDFIADTIESREVAHAIVLESHSEERSTEVAQLISCIILCKNREICGYCKDCKKVFNNTHPDVEVIEGNKSIKIDVIRGVRMSAYIKPNEAVAKIFIIKGATEMTVAAQNALLKILEEPPENVFFLLIVKEAKELLTTVLSRVQVVNLDISCKNTVDKRLYERAKQQLLNVSEGAYYELMVNMFEIDIDKRVIEENLETLELLIRDIVVAKEKQDYSQEWIKVFIEKFTVEELLCEKEVIDKAKSKLKYNVNMELFLTWISAKMIAELRNKRRSRS